jgi:AcrR family transcriptional regulator
MALSTRGPGQGESAAANRRLFRSEILAAATEVFAAHGYRATNLGDVAKRLGVTRQALYYHFPSKDDILFGVFLSFFDILDATVEDAVAGIEEPGERFRAMLRAHVKVVAEQPLYSSVFVQEHRALPEAFESLVMERRRAVHRRFVVAYQEAEKVGYLRGGVDPNIAVSLMFGAANWTYRWFRPGRELSAADVAGVADDLLMNGMRA